MQRHIKKQLKKLKREKKNKNVSHATLKNKYWPAIFCVHENLFIAFSESTLKPRYGMGKYKIIDEHWKTGLVHFRDPKYVIDFKLVKDGQEVFCPNCKNKLDFRLWLSSVKPRFLDIVKVIENVEDSTPDKLPVPQEPQAGV